MAVQADRPQDSLCAFLWFQRATKFFLNPSKRRADAAQESKRPKDNLWPRQGRKGTTSWPLQREAGGNMSIPYQEGRMQITEDQITGVLAYLRSYLHLYMHIIYAFLKCCTRVFPQAIKEETVVNVQLAKF